MILKGNERGHAAELALHLLNPRDNDHVTVHAIEGFVADDLQGALAESAAISQATQCRNHLFSLSLNPPPEARVSIEVFEAAIAQIEAKLGLVGQPRAIVFHEKYGRRHAHCVWSRIEPTRLRAINLAHSKRKLMDVAQDLFRTHGWEMPAGFTDPARRDALAFSREEAGQAKRAARDPKALKAMFAQCWQQSDSRAAFAAALWSEGYCLARGDRRSFVAVDREGKIWSLSRWCGVAPKDLAARLGNLRIPRKMGIDSTASWAAIPRLGQSGRLIHGVKRGARIWSKTNDASATISSVHRNSGAQLKPCHGKRGCLAASKPCGQK